MTLVQSKAPTYSSRLGANLLTTPFKSKAFGGMTGFNRYAKKQKALPALKDSVILRQDIAQCHFQNKVSYFLPTSI